jgi:hypothetical protein
MAMIEIEKAKFTALETPGVSWRIHAHNGAANDETRRSVDRAHDQNFGDSLRGV